MTLYQKIFNVQQALKPIVKGKENPYYHSQYFTVDDVIQTLKPLLKSEGLVILQPLTSVDGKPAIKTIVIDVEGDKALEIPPMVMPEISDPQKLGSACTYLRRYSLVSLFLIEGDEDDDGNKTVAKSDRKPEDKTSGKDCPKCPVGKLVAKTGRYGSFDGCDQYPQCKYIHKPDQKATERDVLEPPPPEEEIPF